MIMGSGLEDFERPGSHAGFQPMGGKSACGNGQEAIDGAYKKPAIHRPMLGFSAADRNWLAKPAQTRDVAAP